MPKSAPTPCRHPGCGAVLATPGYCDAHRVAVHRDYGRARRGFDTERGFYQSAAWRAGPWWLGYDFGAGNAFAIVEITWRSRSTRFDFMPTTFSIQYSDDGTNWTTAWTGTWTWTSNGQINTTTDPGAGATAGRPLTFAPT